jgi:hypothetical protein
MSDVCTLFEHDYHFGLAAFVNSLVRSGFVGSIWAGYRGALPEWASEARSVDEHHELTVNSQVTICFIPVSFSKHLTYCKPTFMELLLDQYCPEAKSLFYFDPDIIVKCRWSYFEEWVQFGIALCEDIISPLNRNNPLRSAWKSFYQTQGYKTCQEFDVYVNGGFIGILRSARDFLKLWSELQDMMPIDFQKMDQFPDRTYPFQRTDQDALNVAIGYTHLPVSIMDRSGMDFAPYGTIMSHAVGNPKPWNKQFVLMALRGRPPQRADWQFFRHLRDPIDVFPAIIRAAKLIDLMAALAVSAILRRPF